MQDKSGYVVLTEAPNAIKAHFVAGALEAEGIPTHVEEDHLVDEFSMSQKALGQGWVRVLVPSERILDARAVLAALPAQASEEDEDEEIPWDQPDGEREPDPPGRDTAPRMHFAWGVLLAAAAIAFAFLYWQERAINNAGEGEDALLTWRRTDDGFVERWKHNGELNTVTKMSSREIAYQVDRYNRDGKLVYSLLDRDQNGMWEQVWYYRLDTGAIAYVEHDQDQDGMVEYRTYPPVDGAGWRFSDPDDDGYMEIRELVEEETNKVLMRHEDLGTDGYRQVK